MGQDVEGAEPGDQRGGLGQVAAQELGRVVVPEADGGVPVAHGPHPSAYAAS
jgi:hypothetical protein